MKLITKCLIILFIIVLLLAVYDTVYNGLLKGDGYHTVTDQMMEIKDK